MTITKEAEKPSADDPGKSWHRFCTEQSTMTGEPWLTTRIYSRISRICLVCSSRGVRSLRRWYRCG